MAVNPEDALARRYWPTPQRFASSSIMWKRRCTPIADVAAVASAVHTYVHDLVALSLGATRETAEAAHDRGLRAARFGAIKGQIADRLDYEALSVNDAADGPRRDSALRADAVESEGTRHGARRKHNGFPALAAAQKAAAT